MNDGLYKSEDGAALRFFIEPEQNNAASEKHGRAIFDECLYVEVISPGSRESAPVFLLERKYAAEVGIDEPYRGPQYARFKTQIDAYRNGTDSVDVRGTPLAAWPRMTVAMVATAHHAGIYTVEALSVLPETRFSAFGPGARALVEQAKAFCEAAAGNAPTEALAAENAQLRAEIESLKEAVKQLGAAQPTPTPAPAPAAAPAAPEAAPAAPEAPAKGKGAKAGGGNALPII